MSHARYLGLTLPLALLVSLVGCDDGDPGADSGPPPPTTCESLPDELVDGDPEGHADPLGAAAGEVRAGRLTAAQLPEDPTGLATFAGGDFVIANDRYAVLIEDTGASDLYDPFGGRPVGVAAVSGGALVEAGDFNELIFGLGLNLVETERVTVLADGSDGGAAIIRASGPMGPLEFVGALGDAIPGGDEIAGLPAAIDYRLAPGSDEVEVSITVQSRETRGYRLPLVIAAVFQASRMPVWTEALGFDISMEDLGYAAFVDDDGTSYALAAPEGGSIQSILDQSGVYIFNVGRSAIPGCGEVTVPLGSIVLGGPGLSGLQRSLAARDGRSLRNVTGTVTHADGSPAPEVRVHVRRADGRHFTRFSPAEDGTFSVDVPEEAVELFVIREGSPMEGPIAVAAGTSTATIQLPPTGTIGVTITAEDMTTAIPARVQVVPVTPFPATPADMGERRLGNDRVYTAFVMDGRVQLEVAPGDYDVIVTRGFEYELTRERVSVAAAAEVEVTSALAQVVDSTGVMCADYHIHTHRSPDSPDAPQLKLLSLVADGLEIAIRSDHEWVNDFEPVIAELGIGQHVRGIGGEELTTFAYGHFGVFPLTEDRSQRSGSAVPWVGQLPPAVFNAVRARPEQPALIINHPRSGGSLGGYFNAAGFDRETGMVANADHWDEGFTLVEVFNDDSFNDVRDGEVQDWFALLGSGRRVFAVGSSDSHKLDSSPVGWPRTCLALGSDDPRAVTPNMVRDATAAGHSVISGGILLDVRGPGGEGPGDTVSGAGATTPFDVTVQAPNWVTGTLTLEVIVDGATVETITLTEADRDMTNPAVRLRSQVTVPDGSWVVFHVGSDADLAPLHPGRAAFAVSNPVFLE